MAGAAGSAFAVSAQPQQSSPAVLELRWFRLRNTMDKQRERLADFIANVGVPALQQAGAGPIGVFSTSVGPDSPSVLMLVQHATIADFQQSWMKASMNPEFQPAARAFFQAPGLPFQRYEVELLLGFRGFPAIEVPPAEGDRRGRVFELRTYESNTPYSLARKIGMFESGEIDIFRKYGLLPVFFGQMIAGPRMPNLTYMIAFDSMAAREANWSAFGGSPEWKALAATPGLSDGEVVSNITNVILTPMRGSMIR